MHFLIEELGHKLYNEYSHCSEGTGKAKTPIPRKTNGGMTADDFITAHSEKHMYNPNKVSTKNKTQYGKDVDVAELREDTMLNPDSVEYNSEHGTIVYKKEYGENISTPDIPTGSNRVYINLNDPSKNSQFSHVPRNK